MTLFFFATFLFTVALTDHSLILSVLYLAAMWGYAIRLMLPSREQKEVGR